MWRVQRVSFNVRNARCARSASPRFLRFAHGGKPPPARAFAAHPTLPARYSNPCDGYRRMIVHHQKIVHGQAAGSAVSISERMDVLKLDMIVSRDAKQSVFRDSVQLAEQLTHLIGHILRRSSDFISAGHVVMKLVFTGTLAQLVAAKRSKPIFARNSFISSKPPSDDRFPPPKSILILLLLSSFISVQLIVELLSGVVVCGDSIRPDLGFFL